jgi:hypothetical protein
VHSFSGFSSVNFVFLHSFSLLKSPECEAPHYVILPHFIDHQPFLFDSCTAFFLFVQLNSGGAIDLEEDPFQDDEEGVNGGEACDKVAARGLSMAEQVDEIIDHSIEIESNKRMRNANLNAWTLRFHDVATENKVKAYVNFVLR